MRGNDVTRAAEVGSFCGSITSHGLGAVHPDSRSPPSDFLSHIRTLITNPLPSRSYTRSRLVTTRLNKHLCKASWHLILISAGVILVRPLLDCFIQDRY